MEALVMLDDGYEALASRIAARVADMLRENPPPVPASPWLNSEDAALYCGLSTKTLEAYRHNRNRKDDQTVETGPDFILRGTKIRRYNISALNAWLQSGAKV